MRLTAFCLQTLFFKVRWVAPPPGGRDETGWDLGPFAECLNLEKHLLLEQQNAKKL